MTKQEFLDKLKAKLLDAGLSNEVCDQRCEAISRGFSKLSVDEARQYFTETNINLIVQRLTGAPKPEEKPRQAAPDQPARSERTAPAGASAKSERTAPTGEPEKPEKTEKPEKAEKSAGGQPERKKAGDESSSTAPTPTIVIPKSDPKSGEKAVGKQDSDIAKVSGASDVIFVSRAARDGSGKHGLFGGIDDSIMSQGSSNPKLLLAAILVLCAPMALFLVFGVLGLSLGVALAMASVILAVVCIIAAVVCGGSILAILSLIYGITQIISEPRYVGFHEIGLAMLFAGVTILISVLLYNVAVRLIPFLYKLIGKGLRTLAVKIRKLLSLAWKGCKSL